MPWFVRRSPQTIAYERPVISELIGSSVEEVSIKEGIGDEAVMGIMGRHIQAEVDWSDIDSLGQMGLDEIALKKGHKDFVVIISARLGNEMRIRAVLKDRKKETVKDFFSCLPNRLRKTIRSVCCDLYAGFINAAKEVFGKRIRIVVDRFHVAKLYRKGLDSLRKQELKRLKEELSEQAYSELKGAMWVLRKTKQALTKKDKALLKKLFQYSPLLEIGYNLQNDLTNIFEMDISRSGGKRRIKNWMCRVKESGIKCYNKFLATLDSYLEAIVNYFINRESSGDPRGAYA